jgi:hypothetical protein
MSKKGNIIVQLMVKFIKLSIRQKYLDLVLIV